MADITITKTNNKSADGVTLTGGAGPTTHDGPDLLTGLGALMLIKVINGATAPSTAAQVQPQWSGDDSVWFDIGGALVASADNNGEAHWPIKVPKEAKHCRTVSTHGDDQDVTLHVHVVQSDKAVST